MIAIATIKSINPFAWLTRPPLTHCQILLHDLSLELSKLREEQLEVLLDYTDICHRVASLEQQIKLVQQEASGTVLNLIKR